MSDVRRFDCMMMIILHHTQDSIFLLFYAFKRTWYLSYFAGKRSISSLDLRTKGSAERSKDISWSPSGRFVAVCSGRHSLRVIDTRTMAVCAEMSFRPHFPQSIMWMTDSEIVVSTTGGTLDVISCIGRSDEEGQDPSDLDLSYHLRRIGQKIASYEPTMCISRGRGNNFVVGSNDGVVALWDAEDMCCSKPLDQLDYGVITCAFSHDGRFVTYISKEVTEVSAIDVETGQRKVVAKDCSPLLSLAMHPLQYVLACAGSSRDERRDKNPIQLFGMRKK
eukprot:TRINITY_DN1623_c0_g1_i2.p1 TRINITY_DN1623_c0_g1~~TRINITY_DN1623_c0_g1_i2.p1  ORF type:complete len:278 (-),score=66.13 TRINITY_DN1623_c0_g1_i2:23-856(-)